MSARRNVVRQVSVSVVDVGGGYTPKLSTANVPSVRSLYVVTCSIPDRYVVSPVRILNRSVVSPVA